VLTHESSSIFPADAREIEQGTGTEEPVALNRRPIHFFSEVKDVWWKFHRSDMVAQRRIVCRAPSSVRRCCLMIGAIRLSQAHRRLARPQPQVE
jgi:hypothetical protein